jgi:hypothetical protein
MLCIVCPEFWGSLARRRSSPCEDVGFTWPAWELANRFRRKPSRRTPASEPRFTTFEKRAAMPDGKGLAFMLWLTASLVLLASVVGAPIRTCTVSPSVSFRPDCLPRDFAPPTGKSTTRLGAAMASDTLLLMNALPSENEEEQDRADHLVEPRVFCLIPYSFRNAHDRQLIDHRSILSIYPLRC